VLGPGEADVLTGEAAGENVDRLDALAAESARVDVARDARPVSREDSPAERIGLALPRDAHPGSFEAEIETADPGEQASDREPIIHGRLPAG